MPVREEFLRCPVCGGETLWKPGSVPSPDWEERVREANAPQFHAGEEVVAWRYEQLTKAGFDELTAMGMAADRSIDLDLARRLAANEKCGVELALEILR